MTTVSANCATEPPVRLSATDFRNYCVSVWVLGGRILREALRERAKISFRARIRLGELMFPDWLSASGQTLRCIAAAASSW